MRYPSWLPAIAPTREGTNTVVGRIPYKWLVAAVYVLAHLREPARSDDHERRAAGDGARVRGLADRRRVGGDELPAQCRRLHPGQRLARRPVRDEAGLRLRAGDLHARLLSLRHREWSRAIDRLPRVAGNRRRVADAGRRGDGLPGIPTRGAGACLRTHHHPGSRRARARAGRRWLPRAVLDMARDLPHQCADRPGRPVRGDHRVAGIPRRGDGSTRPAGVRPGGGRAGEPRLRAR